MQIYPPVSARSIVLTILVLFLITAAAISPIWFTAEAGPKVGDGLLAQTSSHRDDLPNYDIRADKAAVGKMAEFRERNGTDAAAVAERRAGFIKGENKLRARVPSLKVDYNPEMGTPESIAPDVKQGRAFLTERSGQRRADTLVNFLKQNREMTGLAEAPTNELKLFSDYTNPDGNLSFVELEQEIDGIPVFRGSVKAAFSKDGAMFRVINNLAPGLESTRLPKEFGDPAEAVRAAAGHIGNEIEEEILATARERTNELKTVFGDGESPTTAEKIYFPTEPGVAVAAWRVLLWQPVEAYYLIVDAADGTLLWRKNITEDQSQSATYNVYTNPNAMLNAADSPAPLSPGPVDPTLGTQGPGISRSDVTIIGNEAPYEFNNLGWITDGVNQTQGNNVAAGLDRWNLDMTNNIDSFVTGSSNRVFSYTWNPPPGNPAPADQPYPPGTNVGGGCPETDPAIALSESQKGAVTQMFYVMNRFHDETYRLGFTEAARNFQNDNFGRGGLGNDRVNAQGQDCAGTNNANFSTPPDGFPGQMQMFIFPAPDPDRDGTIDSDVIIHEATHGLSNRLIGNAGGLSTGMALAMGEGWSDFYAHALLSEPSDDLNGVYPLAEYVTLQFRGGLFTSNYYYGIRRFPKAVIAFTGVNGKPHNPLTFADIDGTQINLGDGAFAPAFSGTSNQVHAAGEIWSSALWEVRGQLVQRLGWENGNRKSLQLVTDGMKISPLNPTFLQARDAIIAAALAGGTGADVNDIWTGFALRGMGASASIQNAGTVGIDGSGNGDARVTEAFDLPNITQSPAMTVSDAPGDNDGIFEPGEPVTIQLPLSNNTGNFAMNVSAQLNGGSAISYGSIAHLGSASNQFNFTIPANTPCGGVVTLTFTVNSSLGQVVIIRKINTGSPVESYSESFDGVAAPAIPADWTVTSRYGPMTFVNTTNNPDTPANSLFAADLPNCPTADPDVCPIGNGGDTDLTSPNIPINVGAALVSFRNRYNTEAGWDGGVLEISISGGPYLDILAAGGSFISNGYNTSLGSSDPNPLGGRQGWSGNSNGYVTSVAQLPQAAAGQNIKLRWRFGADFNTAPVNGGWNIDTVKVFGNATCSFTPLNGQRPRADFDGDLNSDISIWRPGTAEWWVLYSGGGYTSKLWGQNGDKPVPADYDGDHRTDYAIWRPSDGKWWVFYSGGGSTSKAWGQNGDIPMPADYNNDGKADYAIWRPTTGEWWVFYSNGGYTSKVWGQNLDVPVAADYDGDGKADYAIWRPSDGMWWVFKSGGGFTSRAWGQIGDIAVPADYDNDGKADHAIWRPSTGEWWVLNSGGGYTSKVWGVNGDVPVPADYDGDHKADYAIFRPSDGMWWVFKSGGGYSSKAWGQAGDIPAPAGYIP